MKSRGSKSVNQLGVIIFIEGSTDQLVTYLAFFRQGAFGVDEIKEIFMRSAIKFDRRDWLVQGISALNG